MGSSCRSIVAYAPLGNGTGWRTATLVASLLLISRPVKYEVVLHSCGTSPVVGREGGYRLVTVHTHSDFIVLPHCDISPLT